MANDEVPFRVGDAPVIDLAGHVSVVTGGNSGIGLGIARGLVRAGADVAVVGRDEERNTTAVAELAAVGGGTAWAYHCDVSDEAEVVRTMAQTRYDLGPIRSLFASAGVPSSGSAFVDLTLDDFRRVLAVNLEGAFLCFREAARHMVHDEVSGSLVAIASLSAVHGQSRGQSYSASKGGLVAMVRACAVELARDGIRANVILPGAFDTPMAAPFQRTEAWDAKIRPRIPQRRPGHADEVAGAAVYLASQASAYHTGDTLVIDGGYSVY
ncbi:SDR family NAD(P)-dependent oxidoreductase [Aeromicrobium ginsengisoli]|uniref:SDR family oxidoreductase n=1 Tax=Aeromicrobium ginsengisoli TaxID=363867 RepID=A0A5M4F936_9ACTN|nr:SDR family oxidoreductase [Aeromicrobium ginsengisoli]KAA1394280.1 SDR family oxidoreductase [Aeromicrobium ginsengisoli]